MSKRCLWALAAALLPLASGPASATPWVNLGPRAMGMGGAQVAIADGPLGAYYNPGMLGQEIENPSGFQIPAGGGFELTGNVIEGANDAFELKKACAAGSANCTAANISNALAKLNEKGNGALANVQGGLNFKFGRFALFANNFTFAGATPVADTVNVAVGPAGSYVTANSSKLIVRGAQFYEFGAGYGHELWDTGLFLGANLKGIVGRVGYTDFSVAGPNGANPEVGSVLRNFDRSVTSSFQPGIDVGLLWDARDSFPDVWWHPRVGFVGRNVNNPRFDQPGRARMVGDSKRFSSLQGQSRAGFALSPFHWWNIAADIDLTENLSMVDGYATRNYGVGTEFNIFDEPWLNIPLRAGARKNIVRGDSGTVWTGGFGLNFIHVMFDFAGEYGERRAQVQSIGSSERLPHQAAVSVQLAVLFGGAEAISDTRRDPFLPSAPKAAPQKVSPTYGTPGGKDPFRR